MNRTDEMPTFSTSNYASTAVNLVRAAAYDVRGGGYAPIDSGAISAFERRLGGQEQQQQMLLKEPAKVTTRIVQVFIADPNENLPLADRLLYKSEQFVTDLTDNELYWDIDDVKGILKAHNEKRVKTVDKSVKDRVQHLEPARIRDLRFHVTTAAQF